MKKTIYIFLTISLFLNAHLSAEINFPQDDFIDGWTKARHSKFSANNLYGYINGGAELFLEFGFDELIIQRYQKGDAEISAEIYIMDNPLSALGIYLAKCGKETPNSSIKARNSVNEFQFTLVQDRYFIFINNFEGTREFVPVMDSLAQHILVSLPESSNADIWEYLPEENKVSGSEQIIRGPYSLQPIYTFGKGDILQLNGEVFGYLAAYRNDGAIYTQIVIPYPDVEKANSTFQNLSENLDPYLKILIQSDNQFVFENYQQKFGTAKLEGCILTLIIHLENKPHID